MDLPGSLRSTAQRVPAKQALVQAEDGRAVTYAELDGAADRIAAGLQALGVPKGDRVAVSLVNSIAFAEVYFGALRAGAVVVPLNVMLTPPEIARILDDSEAAVAVGHGPLLVPLEEAAQGAATAVKVLTPDAVMEAAGGEPADVVLAPDDLALLAYTSGTTGEPKGAMLTHGNLFANLQQQMEMPEEKVTEDDVLLLTLPMFHIFGLNVPLGLAILNGAMGVIVERFEPVACLRHIEKYRPTILFGAPTMYTAWVDTPGADQYELSSVRLAVSGAAPLPERVLTSFREIFGVVIYEGYGMTETAPTLTTNRMTDEPRAGSVGKPLPGVELRLLTPDGEDVELGDPGEVAVRGPNVFKGYWRRPEENEEIFRDGWFMTGDIGVRDEDGYIYLVDRKRDLIIVSGFNVFPSEVEAALLRNPDVAEAAVVGVAHPYTGEAVKAYVVTTPGAVTSEGELKEDVATRLARFKCPAEIEIVDSLPHLPTGKVLRRALRT